MALQGAKPHTQSETGETGSGFMEKILWVPEFHNGLIALLVAKANANRGGRWQETHCCYKLTEDTCAAYLTAFEHSTQHVVLFYITMKPRSDAAASGWRLGWKLGAVVNLGLTVVNCSQISLNLIDAIQLIYTRKRFTWVFLYFWSISSLQNDLAFYLPTWGGKKQNIKKKLPQSSVRC